MSPRLNAPSPGHEGAFPILVPPRLLAAFRTLKEEPVLSGGSAVQVWTGRSDDIFETFDLDFITGLRVWDLVQCGLHPEPSGRHLVVDGVAVEFPSGPLGVGDLFLDSRKDTVLAPTTDGEWVRVIRPEACVLDRLTLVAGSSISAAFLQAAAVVVAQSSQPSWDQDWLEAGAMQAGLGRLWNHLRTELEKEQPSQEGLEQAIRIGWDR